MRKFKHKRSTIVVKYDNRNFYQHMGNADMKFPVVVVEDSVEWEEIKPIVDPYGKEIDPFALHYKVLLLSNGTTTVWNGLNILPKHEKILAHAVEYADACKFQRVYTALVASKDLLIDAAGAPTLYLANVLKTL